MNLGSMIRNAAGRLSGRTGTTGTGRGYRMNTAGRTPRTTGAAGGRAEGMAHRIMGMLRRH
ncbi:hypothetical protein ACLH0K_09815 [Arthrobacter sp. MPF02]|uniref:hypothetical protein n=1 Tax=Arthrobacter sp. MPF02 TaxID=3388492 RepID=UPI00398472FE